ncbi:alpha/beta hydrolase [Pseudoalteromonas pernae]|uniref:alpha/beta hydrolase n=1 Tax=Pseudoalteromonas pernae TaxID=3118054 RepID=UPI003241BA85
MRFVWFLLVLVSGLSQAQQTAYTIARSAVIELEDTSSGRTYPILIKLPRSYHNNGRSLYPVIYLADGHYSFQTVSGATRFPMNSGALPEAVIVAIGYSNEAKGVASRVRDYTPTKDPSWKLETGEAGAHARFIREKIFTYVANHYRVDQSQRFYMGHSLAGLFGAYMALHQPDMFTGYVISSPSVWFNNNSVLTLPFKPSQNPPKIYISVGSLETPEYGEGKNMVEEARKLETLLRTLPKSHSELKMKIIDDARHATAFPTSAIQGLDWLMRE